MLLLTGPRDRFAALLLLTTLQWLLRYSALWFVLLELGYRLPLGFVLAVQAVVGVANRKQSRSKYGAKRAKGGAAAKK